MDDSKLNQNNRLKIRYTIGSRFYNKQENLPKECEKKPGKRNGAKFHCNWQWHTHTGIDMDNILSIEIQWQ